MSLNETFRTNETKFFKFFLLALVFLTVGGWQFALAQDQAILLPKDSTQKAETIYYLKLALSKPIPADAVFIFQFDAAFDLSNTEIAGSSSINGGFEIKVDGQKLTISRTGLGEEIPAKKKVELKFALVKNPDQAAKDFPVDIEIQGGDVGVLLKTRVTISIEAKK
ncbi:MAG: hypothetical protein GXO74_00410 [Calditrichaeota bacterium]|nr:hypothetical protein [Calditrichota bacterium]